MFDATKAISDRLYGLQQFLLPILLLHMLLKIQQILCSQSAWQASFLEFVNQNKDH